MSARHVKTFRAPLARPGKPAAAALQLLSLLLLIAAALPAARAQTAPANDDFAAAEILAGNGTWSGSSIAATKEPGEPNHAGNPGGASVWFSWTAPADGALTVDTFSANYDTLLAMYTGGAVDALAEVASNDDTGGLQSQLAEVPVSGGTTYRIAVDGWNGAVGDIVLQWSFGETGPDVTPPTVDVFVPFEGATYVRDSVVLANYVCTDPTPGSGLASCTGDVPVGDPIDTATAGPRTFSVFAADNAGNTDTVVVNYTVVEAAPNDDFANAETLPGDSGSVNGTNVGATAEPGEPAHGAGSGASVWYRWTAAADGFLTADTFGSDFDTVLAMYSGSAVDALTQLAANDDTLGQQSEVANVPVAAGETYHIAVDGYLAATGQVTLNWSFWDGADVTPPTVAVTLPVEGATYVQNGIVPASYSCADEALGSGIASCIGDVPAGEPIDTSVTGPNVFTVTATDVAGNVTVATVDYTVAGADTTPPVVTLASPADGTVVSQGSVLTADYSCTDETFGSGIASCTGDVPDGTPIDTSVVGPATFTVTGTDNAGNSAVVTANYTVIDALANDNFAEAAVLADAGTWTGTNVGATKESGEPNHANNPGGASVWFRWTAPIDGFVTVDTVGSDFDTVLAMYTGSAVDAVTEVASNDDASGLQSRLNNVAVAAGTVYHLAVDGYAGATGSIVLNWSADEQFDTVPPTVRIFDPVDGILLAQGAVENSFYTCTDEFGGSGIATCIGDVPSGDPIDTSVPGDFVFTVTGTDNAGNVTVETAAYSVVANPANDDFADAVTLATDGTLAATNAGATLEDGEPFHAGRAGGTSIWYRWTAPADGFLTVNTFGSDFDTLLALYTGGAVDALTEVASNDDAGGNQSELRDVAVTAGTTYSIAVAGYLYATGNVTLNWSFIELNDQTAPTVQIFTPADGAVYFEGVSVLADYACTDEPLGAGLASCVGDVADGAPIDTSLAGDYSFTVTGTDNAGNVGSATSNYTVQALTNDDFGNALDIAGSGELIASNAGATTEAGEPVHAGVPGGASVWFRWTAAEDGFFSVDTFGSDFDTTLAVYAGTTLADLVELGASNDAGGPQSEVVDIPVAVGDTLYIAVDGAGGATGQIDLDWLLFGGPAFLEVTPPLDPLWVTDADHDFWLNAAAPADVDGDGDLDLAVIGFFVEYNVSAEDRLVVFLNDGPDAEGNWQFTTQDVPLVDQFAGASDLAWGDFDNDGDPDLAVASEGVTALYRNDAGTLVLVPTELPGYYEDSGYTGAYDLRSVTWADYDNDADLDLLIPSVYDFDTFAFRTELVRNDGDDGAGGWLFTPVETNLDGTVHAQTAWADNDGDGDLDLFMANVDNFTQDGFVRTYRNDGGGVFVSSEPIGSLAVEYGLADWSDYDGDGDLDILVAGLVQETDGSYATVLRVYDNEAGVFVPNTLIQSSFFPWLDLYAATWADYDSDGDVDILITGQVIGEDNLEGRSEVYVNDGGTFTPLGRDLPAPIGTVGRGGSFTWMDIDDDGDLDYFVAGAYYVPFGNGLVEAQMHLYLNESVAANAAPASPSALNAEVDGNSVDLSWAAAEDDATSTAAITYELEVRPQAEVRSAMTQHKRLPEPGNVSAVTSWTVQGLEEGAYTWMVQAVDSAFNGGIAAEGSFTIGDFVDSDGDGIADSADNCLDHANAGQRDTDADGYGNRCDPDFNNDGIVNFIDLAFVRGVFFTPDPDADLNGDGVVNFLDTQIVRSFFFLSPGPSGIAP